jgi:hypothetical protein
MPCRGIGGERMTRKRANGEQLDVGGDEARIPTRIAVAVGRSQTAYRAYLDHAMECAGCSRGGRCEAGEALWSEYAGRGR